MGGTKWWAFALAFVTTLFTSIAQVMYKFGSKQLSWPISSILTNVPFMLGWVLYGIGALVMIAALKGGEVTVLYPVVASSYVWVLLLSKYYFGESINGWKIFGIIVIILGIGLISWGSRDQSKEQASSTEAQRGN